MFLDFEQTLRSEVDFVSFNCDVGVVGKMGGSTSPACAVVEMMLMSQAKHVIGIGASSFTLWAVKMMEVSALDDHDFAGPLMSTCDPQIPSATRLTHSGGGQDVCVRRGRDKSAKPMFGTTEAALLPPIQYC